MRSTIFLILFFAINVLSAQEDIKIEPINAIPLDADLFVGTDEFENNYYVKGNTLIKANPIQKYTYTNTRLGSITSVDITNPLKIVVFYRDFNTFLILDNRLNELSDRINLSEAWYGKNATFASISSNNNVWLYSLDDNVLSLWNYEKKAMVFETQPLQFYTTSFEAERQISNYEKCWLASEKGLLEFNQYGSFMNALSFTNILAIQATENGVWILDDSELYYIENGRKRLVKAINSEHLSTNFFVDKNTLTFFRSGRLFRYRILKN